MSKRRKPKVVAEIEETDIPYLDHVQRRSEMAGNLSMALLRVGKLAAVLYDMDLCDGERAAVSDTVYSLAYAIRCVADEARKENEV